jgi:hypothetical protein
MTFGLWVGIVWLMTGASARLFWTFAFHDGQGFSLCTYNNISGRTALWCWLLVWVVWIAACTETFSELNCHNLSVCIKGGWNNKTWFVFVCLFGYLFWPDIYSVMAVNYFSCNLPCGESCPPCNRKCAYTCKHSECSGLCGQPCTQCKVRVSIWFICTSYILFVTLCTHVHTIDIKASAAMVVIKVVLYFVYYLRLSCILKIQ